MIEQLTNKVGDTMNNFFDKFEKDQKLNLFIGDFLSKITGYPTRLEMAESILSDIKQSAKGYIRNIDSREPDTEPEKFVARFPFFI